MAETELSFIAKLICCILAVFFGFFNMALGYFFKKKFDTVDKNTEGVQQNREDIIKIKVKMGGEDDKT